MVRMLRATKASKNSPEITVEPTPPEASGGIISGGAVSAGKTSGEVAGSRRGLRVESGRRRPCLGNWKWMKLGLVVERAGEDGLGGGEVGVKGKTRGRAAMTAVGRIIMAMASSHNHTSEFGSHEVRVEFYFALIFDLDQIYINIQNRGRCCLVSFNYFIILIFIFY